MGVVVAEPLLPEELDYLQTQLVEHMESAGCMPLDIAHGFLTAVAGGPDDQDEILLDRVVGTLAGDADLRALLTRFHAQLLLDLRSAEFGPLILQMPRDDGSSLPLPYGWCQWYVAGMEFMGEDQRDRLFADELAGSLITPVLSFLMYEQDQWFDPPNEAAHREAVAELGAAAVGLFQWRQEQLDC